MYQTILIGTNTFYPDWLNSIKKINKDNIILIDFSDSELLEKTIAEKNIKYILPLSDIDYTKIMSYKFKDITILYPNKETHELLNNKLLFTKFMMKPFNDFIPTVFYLDNKKIRDIEYPVISKPIYSVCGKNMKIYKNDTEFSECKDKTIIQKFITDPYEYAAYILCINGNIKTWKIIRFKFEKFHIKTSNFPKNYETVNNIDIKLFEKLMKKLKYTGGTCINFKYNTTTKKIDIFELNPRFGGSAFTNNFIYELLCIN